MNINSLYFFIFLFIKIGNYIRVEGCKYLSEVLKINNSLQQLILWSNL